MITSNSSIDWTKFMSEQEKQELIGTPEFREWLVGVLNDENKSTTITFTKKDGTTRTMRCSRNPSLIPEEHHPKESTGDTGSGAIKVFDLDKNEWRSFLPENVQRIDYHF